MRTEQLTLINTETQLTQLGIILQALRCHLIGGVLPDNRVISGNSFFKSLLFDSDKNDYSLYDYSFTRQIANFDPAISIFHTNNEKYKPEKEGRVDTKGLIYIEVLIRDSDDNNATELVGRLLDKARQTIMTNPNLFGYASEINFLSKEMLNINENDVLYTRIGRLQIEVKYSLNIVNTR